MAKKIFISYKHSDNSVETLTGATSYNPTTARDYVNIIQNHFQKTGDHIYKGENNDESLADFKDDAIRSKLAKKIYDSSVTIVLISPNMKESFEPENDQWIPWEISYSLREKTRNGIRSRPNAILAVILPDKNGKYEYANELYFGFNIINKNKDNLEYSYPAKKLTNGCSNSYILTPTWKNFTENYEGWINASLEIRENIDKYKVSKTV